jgi:acyl-CoA hydrolase
MNSFAIFAIFASFTRTLRRITPFLVFVKGGSDATTFAIVAKREGGSMSSAHPAPIRMVEMIFPEHSNHYGTLFAGNAMAMLAKAAFVAATRHAGCSVVMARAEKVDFLTPVRVGEMLDLTAQVIRAGRASMTVEVRGEVDGTGREAPVTVLTGIFEMVAVDGAGKPRAFTATTEGEESA